MHPFPFPDGLFAAGPSTKILDLIAFALTHCPDQIRGEVPPALVGVAFYSEEASGVQPSVHEVEAQRDPMIAAAEADRIRMGADRIEVRLLTAVDRDGLRYFLQLKAGEITTHIASSGQTAHTLAAAVPEALDRILEALLGVTVPARPAPGRVSADADLANRKLA
ncbi:hypothetical protein [Nocardia transvalensis]|uniref:hypothetical protein n=1 Tax=Nocardia transvalensis TaxID=37333 RepID=UPI0018959BF5|nr:hypothetical protein [Nocardia transvalensis]MBF6333476.1 hypothetical protein [Nocardia transvalensis]